MRLRDISESLGITGCSSGACVFGAPVVHTNGKCACVRDEHPRAVAHALARLVRELDKKRGDYER